MDKFIKIDINQNTSIYKISYGYFRSFEIIIPEIQRNYVENRIIYFYNLLEKYMIEKNELYNLNPLQIGELNNKYYILDGQHRFMSYERFYERYFKDINGDFEVSLITTRFNNMEEMNIYFLEINNNFISDELINTVKNNDIRVLLKNYLVEHYNNQLSNVENPRTPNINPDKLIDDLITRYGDDLQIIIKNLEEKNEILEKYLKTYDIDNYNKIKNKSGLYYVYLLNKTDEIEDGEGRKKIPQAVRIALWELSFGRETMIGKCYVCKKEIDFHTFHSGHVRSVYDRGSNNIKNLECVCSICNNSMKIENMMNFKNKYFG